MLRGMPSIKKELSLQEINGISRPGWHAVGGVPGLLVQIRRPSNKESGLLRSWILRLTINGRRRAIGLGPLRSVSPQSAKVHAQKLSLDIRLGIDPLEKRRSQRASLKALALRSKSFEECAKAYFTFHASDYTNAKHRKQWMSTLEHYAYPELARVGVGEISVQHIMKVLNQPVQNRDGSFSIFWHVRTETAKRVLYRIRKILDYAEATGHRSGPNPAIWKGFLANLLPAINRLRVVQHLPALPYQQVGNFIRKLRAINTISSRALEFLILTGMRSGSIRLATFSEIDFTNKIWTIPKEHFKTRKEFRVPLQPQAIELLKNLLKNKQSDSDLIFPSPKGAPLTDVALSHLMIKILESDNSETHGVPHGFRSTFRDWAAEKTNYSDEIRKSASGHSTGDPVKNAYQRTDLLDKRRELMIKWANFLDQPSDPSVQV